MYTYQELKKMQERPFERKIMVTYSKFLEFCMYSNWKVSISFSGGADSSVLLDMFGKFWSDNSDAHSNSELLVIYANTSNEFATMPNHVRGFCEYIEKKYNIKINLKIVRGKTSYADVCKTIGYPVVSKKVARMVRDVRTYLKTSHYTWDELSAYAKYDFECVSKLRDMGVPKTICLRLTGITSENRKCNDWKIPKKWLKLITAPFEVSEKCCDILKKEPLKLMQKELGDVNAIIGTLAEDSKTRTAGYLQTGCNSFLGDGKGKSTPMGFWLRQDVLRYLYEKNIPIAPPYGELEKKEDNSFEFTKEHNTGCKLCLFGCHMEKGENRMKRLEKLEPATYSFAMKSTKEGGLGYSEILEFLGIKM